jgi:hypothetical protein
MKSWPTSLPFILLYIIFIEHTNPWLLPLLSYLQI